MAGTLDGQLWFTNNGNASDLITGYVNSDGSGITHTSQGSNNSDGSLAIAVDLAAGFYFVIASDQLTLQVRSIANPGTVIDSVEIGDPASGPATQDIVQSIAVDPTTHTLYIGRWGQTTALTGIVEVNYNTATGALDHNAAYNASPTFLITNTGTGGKITDVRDISIDLTNHLLYFTDDDNQFSGGGFSPTDNISVVNYTGSPTVTQLTTIAQFPANQSGGIIGPEAVDIDKGLVYFETNTAGHSAATLWYMSTSGGTATAVTLPAGSALGFGDIPQGGISIDEQSQYIFITVQNGSLFAGPNEILQGQLSADGHSITSWVNTYPLATLDGHTPDPNGHVADTWFDQLPTLTVAGTTHQAGQNGASVTLLTSNTITDPDGNHLASATVTITGGTFNTGETSAADDHLTINGTASGTIDNGANGKITYSYDSATEKLTLTGYDTLTDYQAAIALVKFNVTGSDPTLSGAHETRTITWQANDGAGGDPSGADNTKSTIIDVDAVSITGTQQQGQTLTATPFTADNANVVTYQWQTDDSGSFANVSGATNSTYTLVEADEGHHVRVVATFTDSGLSITTVATSGQTGTITDSADEVVTITGLTGGNAVHGTGLTVTNVTDNGAAVSNITYQWQRDGVNIANATLATYTPTEHDEGHSLTVSIGFKDVNNFSETTSGSAGTVQEIAGGDTIVSITGLTGGNAVEGTNVTASITDGGLAVTSPTYHWQRDGVDIANATNATYTPTENDEGHSLTVNVSFTDEPGNTETGTGSAGTVQEIAGGDTVVNISGLTGGNAVEGTNVTVTSVTDGGLSVSGITYQWLRDGVNIANATNATYTPTENDEGHALTVSVAFTDTAGNSETGTGNAGSVQEIAGGDTLVTITGLTGGNAVHGTDVTVTGVTDGGLSVSGITYHWQRDGVDIANATNATYTPTENDEGHALTVNVAFTDAAGNAETGSANAGTVAEIAGGDTLVTITGVSGGNAVQGTALTVTSITDGGLSVSNVTYQWQKDGADITNATLASYTPGETDEGHSITVNVSFKDAANNTETGVGTTGTVQDSADTSITITGLTGGNAVQGTLVTVTNVTDGGQAVSGITYQWQRDGVNITNATLATYTPTETDEGHSLTVNVSFTDVNPISETGTGSAGTVQDSNDAQVTITGLTAGNAVEGTGVTVTNVVDNSQAVSNITYQWQRDGVNIANATLATYTPTENDEGHSLTVNVGFTDAGGASETAAGSAGTVAEIAGGDTLVTITGLTGGNAVQGTALTVTSITDGGLSVTSPTYHWQRDGVDILNATLATYTPTESDEGHSITVNVGFNDAAGNAETGTGTTGTVQDSADTSVTFSGLNGSNNAVQGTAVTVTGVTDGAQAVSAITYQWQRDGVNIANATLATYTPTENDEGHSITVNLGFTDINGVVETGSGSAGTVAEIAGGDTLMIISGLTGGNAVQGTAVSVTNITDGSLAVTSPTYQWQRDGVNIANATLATYTPTENDEGHSLTVNVAFTDTAGNAETGTGSAGTVAEVAGGDTLVTITGMTGGNAVQGTTLTVTNITDGALAVTSPTYQWQRDGVNILNATLATYTPTETDEGHSITVNLGFTDAAGNAETGTGTTGTVQDSADALVTISGLTGGNAVEGTAVTVTNVTDNGAAVSSITYQWQRDGVNIANATLATYTPTENDEGHSLTVNVGFTDAGSVVETGSGSAGTVQEIAGGDTLMIISGLTGGNAVQGTAVSVTNITDGSLAVSGATYQWQRDGVNIANATLATYTPTENDEGHSLTVNVAFMDSAGNAETGTGSAGTVAEVAGGDTLVTISGLTGGNAVHGTALTVTNVTDGALAVSNITYQWQRDGVNIANATTATYTPTENDEGHSITVNLAFMDSAGNAETGIGTTGTVQEVAGGDTVVTISGLSSGSAVEGTAVTVTNVTDGGLAVSNITYQWLRDGVNIANATLATYTPTETDEGHALTVSVGFKDAANNSETGTGTAGTVKENPTENAAIVLSGLTGGNAVEGTAVIATVTDPDAPASGITYTWKVNGATVKTGVDAAGNTYTPTETDEGLAITVAVSFTDTLGNAETGSTSAGTVHESPTENAAIALAGLVNGHPQEGKLLIATVTESDAPASGITYTWTSNGSVVKTGVDAAGNSYTPSQTDDGHTIAVSTSFTDTHGFAEHGTATAGVVSGLTHLGAGDFDTDGDKNGDLLWQNGDGTVVTWDMNGAQLSSMTTLGQLPSNWHFVGTGQFNSGLGTTEAWFQSDAGAVLLWNVVNNNVTVNQVVGQMPANWHIFGIGDVNGDGHSDVLAQSDAGAILEWQMQGTNVSVNQVIGQAPAGGHAVAVADFNHDGNSDILFQTDSGDIDMWLLNGTQVIGNATVGHIPSNWHFVATGDFNGDGNADILIRSDAGAVIMWEMIGTQAITNQQIGLVPPNWSLSGTADVNGDGKSDVIFTSDTGAREVWEMNGTQVIADLPVGPSGTPASPPLNAHVSSATSAASSVSDAFTANAFAAMAGTTAPASTAAAEPMGTGGWHSATDPAAAVSAAAGAGGSGASASTVSVPGTLSDHVGGFVGSTTSADALSSLINHDQHFLV